MRSRGRGRISPQCRPVTCDRRLNVSPPIARSTGGWLLVLVFWPVPVSALKPLSTQNPALRRRQVLEALEASLEPQGSCWPVGLVRIAAGTSATAGPRHRQGHVRLTQAVPASEVARTRHDRFKAVNLVLHSICLKSCWGVSFRTEVVAPLPHGKSCECQGKQRPKHTHDQRGRDTRAPGSEPMLQR